MILKFPDEEKRELFLAVVKEEREDIATGLELAGTLPHIVAPSLTEEQCDWIANVIGPYGRAYGDFKFDLFR
jgi:hypothetical protein